MRTITFEQPASMRPRVFPAEDQGFEAADKAVRELQ